MERELVKIITLIAHEDGVEVRPDETVESDQEALMILVSGLVGFADFLAENHECEDENCCTKEVAKELSDALEVTMKLHNLKHRHKGKE